MTDTEDLRYDPWDPELLEDPYPAYKHLRAAGPVLRGGPGQWVVTSHADVSALLRDRRLGHQFPEIYHRYALGSGPAAEFAGRILLDRDPPEHTHLRQRMAVGFSPAAIRRLLPRVEQLASELLSAVAARDDFDAVADLAFPLPIIVICELLGVPSEDRMLVRPHAVDLCKAFGTRIPTDDRVAADRAVTWLRGYLSTLMEQRRRSPTDDLLSTLATSADKHLSIDELVDNAVFLFFAGFETTSNLIATACATLAAHPAHYVQLRDQPALLDTAVEELIRWDTPIQSVARLVREPISIDDVLIRPGRLLVLLLGSANHDDRAFERPESLDLTRSANPHVSFGGGPHFCLGAALARAEVKSVLSGLISRYSELALLGSPRRRTSAVFRSLTSVPLHVTHAR